MELVRQSALYHYLGVFLRRADGSVSRSMLAAWLGAVWRWLGRQYDRSLLKRVMRWESRLDELLTVDRSSYRLAVLIEACHSHLYVIVYRLTVLVVSCELRN